MMNGITKEIEEQARGFKVWTVENALEFPDKVLELGDVILDSEHGAVLTAGGVLQLTGAGKIGKSMLLLNMAYGLALGRDALSFGIDKPRRVLYLNGENSPGTMQERLRCLRDYYCIDHEGAELVRQNLLFTSAGVMLPRPEAIKEMRGNLAEIRPEILILDPLKNFFSGEENSADNMREFMAAVRQLMAEFSLTVIIVHHTGKKQNENHLYSGRGSSVLGDDAEATASFQKDGSEKGRFTLSVTGRNCDEFTLHLVRQPERWFLYSLADAPEPKPDHTLIEIIDELPDEFRTGQFYETAERRGLSDSTAKRRLADARELGLIEFVARGVYRKGSLGSRPYRNDPSDPNRDGSDGSSPKGVAQVTRRGPKGSDGSNDPSGPSDREPF
jgi:hypothetical protein